MEHLIVSRNILAQGGVESIVHKNEPVPAIEREIFYNFDKKVRANGVPPLSRSGRGRGV
jgi:hypothetical protein